MTGKKKLTSEEKLVIRHTLKKEVRVCLNYHIDERKFRSELPIDQEIEIGFLPDGDSIEFENWFIVHNDRTAVLVNIMGTKELLTTGTNKNTKKKKRKDGDFDLKKNREICMSNFLDHKEFLELMVADESTNPEEIYLLQEGLTEEEIYEIIFFSEPSIDTADNIEITILTTEEVTKNKEVEEIISIEPPPYNFYQDYDPYQLVETDPEAVRIRLELAKENFLYSSQWENEVEQFDSMPSKICKTGDRNIRYEKNIPKLNGKKLRENNRHFYSEEKFLITKQKNIAIRVGRKLKQQNLFSGKPSLQVSYLLGL